MPNGCFERVVGPGAELLEDDLGHDLAKLKGIEVRRVLRQEEQRSPHGLGARSAPHRRPRWWSSHAASGIVTSTRLLTTARTRSCCSCTTRNGILPPNGAGSESFLAGTWTKHFPR